MPVAVATGVVARGIRLAPMDLSTRNSLLKSLELTSRISPMDKWNDNDDPSNHNHRMTRLKKQQTISILRECPLNAYIPFEKSACWIDEGSPRVLECIQVCQAHVQASIDEAQGCL
mmetsp:Transcript_38179/g.91393  ORF Transcript_38179/g.91393 Transcript_38179/m.91393 type:complete len:116 (+) Transcript_38179:130-477(+)